MNTPHRIVSILLDEDIMPHDRATIRELRLLIAKAADDMDNHEGEPEYEAAFKAAHDEYDKFMNSLNKRTASAAFVR
jgi:hypothetical protein